MSTHVVNPTLDDLIDLQLDITSPHVVQIDVRRDKSVIWVNVDGVCVLRICQIPELILSNPGA